MTFEEPVNRRTFMAVTGVAAAATGAMSCLTGIAARQSVESGKPVRIADLATL